MTYCVHKQVWIYTRHSPLDSGHSSFKYDTWTFYTTISVNASLVYRTSWQKLWKRKISWPHSLYERPCNPGGCKALKDCKLMAPSILELWTIGNVFKELQPYDTFPDRADTFPLRNTNTWHLLFKKCRIMTSFFF